MRLLITGASGSGTTTLGRALAARRGWTSLDSDEFYWLPSDPPYQHKQELPARNAAMRAALEAAPDAVVSGSLEGWEAEDLTDRIVFLTLAAEIRVPRLRARELAELGAIDEEFIAWAAQYDEGRLSGRSLGRQEAWLARQTCPLLRLDGDLTVATRLARVEAWLDEPT